LVRLAQAGRACGRLAARDGPILALQLYPAYGLTRVMAIWAGLYAQVAASLWRV